MPLLRNLSPKNAGRAKAAQQEISWAVSRQAAQVLEAIKIDGDELQYWKRVDEGNYCSCGYGLRYNNGATIAQDTVNNNQISVAPSQPNLPESQGGSVTVRSAWDDDENEKPKPNDLTQTDLKDNREQTTNKAQSTGEEEDFFSAPDDFDLISGMEQTQCGICLGTGKTNPYALIGGRREVFDYSAAITTTGFEGDHGSRPYSWKGDADQTAFVEYLYILPTYFKACLVEAVRNNTKSVRDLALFYVIAGSPDNTPWQRLTVDFLNSRNGIPTTLKLRVQPLITDVSEKLVFTHFEIVWQYSDFPKAQVGELSVAANAQIRETIMSASFILPPTIEDVTKNDVFYDKKHNTMWLVSDYTSGMTSNREVISWSVNARKMQAYEQRTLLKLVKEKFYEISYTGLQGFSAQMLRDDI